jgi:enamine deaminase RidA (YjgF/YER057c/UK114 family)
VPVVQRLAEAEGLAPNPGYVVASIADGPVAFLSGQVALDQAGEIVAPGDVHGQTVAALRNLHHGIRALGADWPDVLRFGWYVLDAGQVQAVRDARDEVIRPAMADLPNPASTLVQVAALFRPGLLVEVDAVVAVPRR